MNKDFRERVFTPIMMPLTAAGAILLFAWSFSRVLLAVSETLAIFLALAAALYVLIVGLIVSRAGRISSRALGIGLALGLLGVLGAGAVANAAGMRSLEHDEAAVPEGEAEGSDVVEFPEGVAGFVAVDIDYAQAPEGPLPAGEIEMEIVNEGTIEHNVVIEELDDLVVVEAPGGGTDSGTATLEPGTYTYYCSIAGHRAAGMEGQLAVE